MCIIIKKTYTANSVYGGKFLNTYNVQYKIGNNFVKKLPLFSPTVSKLSLTKSKTMKNYLDFES